MLDDKKAGTFIEIGGGHPFESNNSYLLESRYGWSGFSIDNNRSLAAAYNRVRRANCFAVDATRFDYEKEISEKGFPSQVDYLSIDIDPASKSYEALLKLPAKDVRFSVITYEHDRYSSGDKYMNLSRKYLESLGYQIVVRNVRCFGRDFEDWWVDPNVVSKAKWMKFNASEIEFSNLFAAD